MVCNGYIRNQFPIFKLGGINNEANNKQSDRERRRMGERPSSPQTGLTAWTCYAAFVNGFTEAVTAVVFLPMYIHFLLENRDVGKIAKDS